MVALEPAGEFWPGLIAVAPGANRVERCPAAGEDGEIRPVGAGGQKFLAADLGHHGSNGGEYRSGANVEWRGRFGPPATRRAIRRRTRRPAGA